MRKKIRAFFEFEKFGTSFQRETAAGITTFMTMAYIIFVNPAILSTPISAAEKQAFFNAVMMATCLSSALATIVMALAARYPIALAPGMGMNAFFTYEIMMHFGASFQTALGMVFLSGLMFFALTLVHFREMLITAIPNALKHATATGIGLFIAFIGLQGAGIVVKDDVTLVRIGELTSPQTMISLAALAVTVILMAARVRGAILLGIILAGLIGLIAGVIPIPPDYRVVALPPSLASTAFTFDLAPIFKSWELISLCFILLFFELFDTVGTLIGVSEQAGFLDKEGRLPRANRALMADSTGIMVGAFLGTSPVTCYIESAAGVAAGGRTGWTGLVVAALFLLATFFSPTIQLLAAPFVTAPALIVVGSLMMSSVAKISWREIEEAVPAFLTMVIMPLGFSISKGMVAGLVSWPILKLVAGKGREVHPLIYGLAVILVAGIIGDYTLFKSESQSPPATPPLAEETQGKKDTPFAVVAEKKKVSFADPNLEMAVRSALNVSVKALYADDLSRLRILEAPEKGIRSLAGIEVCRNLEYLELRRNEISDLSPLSGLSQLKVLRMEQNQIRDLSPLKNLLQLARLWLGYNQISDISVLAQLPDLYELSLSFNQISDLSPLANHPYLTVLYLNHNQITDLSPLATCPALMVLHAAENQITDLSPLAGLTRLNSLELWANQIRDVSPLVENCKAGGLRGGSLLRIFDNPLDAAAREEHLPFLRSQGVRVFPPL